MGALDAVVTGAISVVVLMAVLWVYQQWKREANIVDVGWTVCVGALSLWFAFVGSGDPTRRLLLALIAGTWSVRLATYLFMTRVRREGEDGRYVALRQSWGAQASWRFFIFFELQAALAIILTIPMALVAYSPVTPVEPWALVAALALSIVSVVGESIADGQLHRFRQDPAHRGVTCRAGLWRYSRHPNYFFEWLHWWVYVALGASAPFGYLTLIGPILMYYLIVYVTGVPPTEARALESRGDDYRRYQQTTNALIPWFPREEK